MSLSDRLTLAMSSAGISQADLARACKVKPPSVHGWLSGKAKFLRGENLLLAAAALGVNQQWLATGEGPMLPGSGEPSLAISAASLAPAPVPGAPAISLAQALEVVAGALSSVPVEKRQALLGVLATYASDPVQESNSLSYLQSELAKTQARAGVHPSSIATGQPPGGKV